MSSLTASLWCWLQTLGEACFQLDPEQRPSFKHIREQLDRMLAQCQAVSCDMESEATAWARECGDRPAVTDVKACSTLTTDGIL